MNELTSTHDPAPASNITPQPTAGPDVKFGRTVWDVGEAAKETEVFTMTVGEETIPLVPFRNWSQLDHHKWVSRGRLPAGPPGFEVTNEHVKIAGEIVALTDPAGCSRLETAIAEWLALESAATEEARRKSQAKPPPPAAEEASPAHEPMRYTIEVDKAGQVHIRCVQGKEVLAAIGLNTAGFKSLYSQGLMRKPHTLQVGALHDWVEIDGAMFSFERGNNDGPQLERVLNEQYLPKESVGQGKDILIFTNPASSTGFDIQFPVIMGGVRDSRRRPLNEDTLTLLQDPVRCGLLRKEIVIKVTRPTFVFKQKTPDGGERYLDPTEENVVHSVDEDGNDKVIDLSHPVNYLHLNPGDLTAVLNHPSIHKHTKSAPRPAAIGETKNPATVPAPPPRPASPMPPPRPLAASPPPITPPPAPVAMPPEPKAAPTPSTTKPASPPPPPPVTPVHRLNEWLREPLSHKPIRHEWFANLVYTEMARSVGNSDPGTLGLSSCWACAFGDAADVADDQFHGLFLTEKGGFGFLNQRHIARFNKGVAFIGTQDTALEGINISLLGAGFDGEGRVVFIVTDDFRAKFGVPEPQVRKELDKLREYGALILSSREVLEGPLALEVVWTAPIEQTDAEHIQAAEWRRPESEPETA